MTAPDGRVRQTLHCIIIAMVGPMMNVWVEVARMLSIIVPCIKHRRGVRSVKKNSVKSLMRIRIFHFGWMRNREAKSGSTQYLSHVSFLHIDVSF